MPHLLLQRTAVYIQIHNVFLFLLSTSIANLDIRYCDFRITLPYKLISQFRIILALIPIKLRMLKGCCLSSLPLFLDPRIGFHSTETSYFIFLMVCREMISGFFL